MLRREALKALGSIPLLSLSDYSNQLNTDIEGLGIVLTCAEEKLEFSYEVQPTFIIENSIEMVSRGCASMISLANEKLKDKIVVYRGINIYPSIEIILKTYSYNRKLVKQDVFETDLEELLGFGSVFDILYFEQLDWLKRNNVSPKIIQQDQYILVSLRS